MDLHRFMRLILSSLGAITILFCVACSGPTPEGSGKTLPPPSIRVIQPTETENPSETFNATSEPDFQLESSSMSEIADQQESSAMMIGTESHHLGLKGGEELLVGSGLQLVRYNALLWQKVEPNSGDRQWDAVAELESKLINAADFGLSTILIVRGTPSWAQKVPGAACGPVRQDKLADFASFLSDAVSRYSSPPFNVKFWELGNEPDVDPSLVRPNSVFGCWGDNSDPYYGGGYYAEMLKVVYPAIKAADPEAKVLIGGLLLDCDPTYPPEGKDCKPGKYLEGILRNGGGEYFDIVSFHGYPP
ncbi:hypothetical protein KA005_69650, partial [bacterium]|nr:hypothetical protein [bacterium]